jgi:membrane protease YdiL (CAAX protease family)
MLSAGLLGIRQLYFIDNGVSKNDILVDMIFPLAIYIILLVSPFLAAKWSPTFAGFDQTWIRRPRLKIRWYVLLISLSLFATMIMGVISKYTALPMTDTVIYKDISKLTLGFFICRSIFTIFLCPVSEEVFWRGYAQDQFSKCFGKRIALFLQAFLFAMLHMRPLLGFTAAFIHGLIWGFWRYKRRSLIPIITAHVIWNGLFALAHYPDQYELSQKKISINYLDELNRIGNTFPAEENAAPFYTKACELFIDPPQEIRDDIRKYIEPNEFDTERQKAVTLWATQNADAIVQLKQGTHKPFYWPNYSGTIQDFTLHEKFIEKEISYALCWNAKLLAQNSELEKAIDELLCCYRLGCHLVEGPKPVISQLTGVGVRRIACKTGFWIIYNIEMNSEQIDSFRIQFERLLRERKTTLDLTCEKLTLYDNIQRVFTDDGNGNGHIPRLELKEAKENPHKLYQTIAPSLTKHQIEQWGYADRKQTIELIDELFSFFNAAFTKTPIQLKNENIDISKTIDEKVENNIISMSIPSFSKIHHIFYQNEAFESAFVTTLAIFSYKSTHLTFPENLEILVSEGHMDSLPADPYSDNPLIYKKAGDSFILYSVAGDFKDDGGKHSEKWNNPDSDYVFWPPADNQE